MKKIICTYSVTCLFSLLIITQNASSQFIRDALHSSVRSEEIAAPELGSAMPVSTAGYYRNSISVRAVRGFLKNFKEAKNVTWSKVTEGGCSAQFVIDSIKTTVVYDQRGSCSYVFMRYPENKMPTNVRAMIKGAFMDYTIVEVTEFKSSMWKSNNIYNVLIKYADKYKIIKICKEEMKTVSDYSLR